MFITKVVPPSAVLAQVSVLLSVTAGSKTTDKLISYYTVCSILANH